MRKMAWILVTVVAALLVVGVGPSMAQDKPADQAKPEQVAAATDPAGDWEGTVETPNGTITFTMSLKIEKDKVSGQIGSPEGAMPLTGTWADGKLTATFDYNGTPITVNGMLKDGALAGDMLYGGQTAMPFTAKHKAEK